MAFLRAAARKAEGANLRRIRPDAFLQIIAHVPDRAVVVRVHGGLCVVLPTHRVLGVLSFDEDGFSQSEYAWRIACQPAGEPLARKVWRAAERITDRDVARTVHRRTCHPAEESVGSVGPLLVQTDVALSVDSQLVPAHAAAARGGID